MGCHSFKFWTDPTLLPSHNIFSFTASVITAVTVRPCLRSWDTQKTLPPDLNLSKTRTLASGFVFYYYNYTVRKLWISPCKDKPVSMVYLPPLTPLMKGCPTGEDMLWPVGSTCSRPAPPTRDTDSEDWVWSTQPPKNSCRTGPLTCHLWTRWHTHTPTHTAF